MKLVIPYIGALRATDRRLVRLAEFLGITCEPLSLLKPVSDHAAYLESAITESGKRCFVINPIVMKEWVGGDCLPSKLSSFLPSHFCHLFVHAVCDEPFDKELISSLSCGHLSGVQGIQSSGNSYHVSSDLERHL